MAKSEISARQFYMPKSYRYHAVYEQVCIGFEPFDSANAIHCNGRHSAGIQDSTRSAVLLPGTSTTLLVETGLMESPLSIPFTLSYCGHDSLQVPGMSYLYHTPCTVREIKRSWNNHSLLTYKLSTKLTQNSKNHHNVSNANAPRNWDTVKYRSN